MVSASRAEASKVVRAKGMIKRSWISIKSKLKSTRRTKKSVEVVSSLHKQIDIDPSPEEPAEAAPSPHEITLSVDPPVFEGNCTCTHSVRTEPPRTSLPSLPGLQTLKGAALLASSAPNEAPPTTLPGHPETASKRQGSGSNDSVRSDMAIFGDTNSSDDTARIDPSQPQKAPANATPARNPQIRVVPIQTTPTQNTPIQVQRTLVNQTEKVEVAKFATPGPTPVFTPLRLKGAPVQFPGLFSPPITPNSPQPKLPGPQQNTPFTPANIFLSPSPVMVVPNLGTPSLPIPTSPTTPTTPIMPATPIVPTTPIMPATPIKHQGRIPTALDLAHNAVASQTPVLPPRSPRRPPPPGGVDPVSTAEGEKKDFGAIGDRRVIQDPIDKPESKDNIPSVKAEPTPERDGVGDARSQEDRDGTRPQPSIVKYGAIYVGEMEYYIGKYLGGGGMGKVYSVVSKRSMSLAALKVIKRKDLFSEDISFVRGEWAVLKAISEAKFFHTKQSDTLQFVHHLLESWYDGNNIYFVMPLCVYSLGDHLRAVKFDSLTIRVYAAELIRGLEALRDMRIIHCDLKPANILVCPDGHLSISDFGLAVSWLDPRYQNYPSHAFRGRRLAGTEGYMAPEIISAIRDSKGPNRGNFGFAADIWSLGIVIAELGMEGRRFVTYDEEEKERWEGDFKRFARTMVLSREMLMKRVKKCLVGDHAILVERMIEIDEASRATFDEIAAHPFFSDLDLEKISRKEYRVPIPPFASVLPCRHTDADRHWHSRHSQTGERGESAPEDDSEDAMTGAVGLTSDIDRWLIPEDFVWELNKAKYLATREARQAATHA